MKKAGEHIRVNFGQSPFVFDIDGMMSASNNFDLSRIFSSLGFTQDASAAALGSTTVLGSDSATGSAPTNDVGALDDPVANRFATAIPEGPILAEHPGAQTGRPLLGELAGTRLLESERPLLIQRGTAEGQSDPSVEGSQSHPLNVQPSIEHLERPAAPAYISPDGILNAVRNELERRLQPHLLRRAGPMGPRETFPQSNLPSDPYIAEQPLESAVTPPNILPHPEAGELPSTADAADLVARHGEFVMSIPSTWTFRRLSISDSLPELVMNSIIVDSNEAVLADSTQSAAAERRTIPLRFPGRISHRALWLQKITHDASADDIQRERKQTLQDIETTRYEKVSRRHEFGTAR